MLRQKLLLVLGSVIALMLGVGVLAVLLMQSVLTDLEHVSGEAVAGTSAAIAARLNLAEIQTEIDRARATSEAIDSAKLRDHAHSALREIESLSPLRADDGESLGAEYDRVRAALRSMSEAIDRLPAGPSGAGTQASQVIRESAIETRQELGAIQDRMRIHAQEQQQRATARFRLVAIGLGLAFVLVINVSIMALTRMSGMILKPIDRLVDASRRLAREDFDSRVHLERNDEFGELAGAFNSLAANLQANEQRKIETLHQVARTLNHELNNAIAIIQLQLDLVSKRSGHDGLQSDRLREIQQALSRMAGTVAALTRVRRIVLTDYLSGVKMLDLEASVADEPAKSAVVAEPATPAHV